MLDLMLILVLIVLSLFYGVQKLVNYTTKNLPPGPKGWPDIFQFDLLGKTFVSLNSSEVLREAFNQEPNATVTANRPPLFLGKYVLESKMLTLFSPKIMQLQDVESLATSCFGHMEKACLAENHKSRRTSSP